MLIFDKWSISSQTFRKVEAYADIANTSFDQASAVGKYSRR